MVSDFTHCKKVGIKRARLGCWCQARSSWLAAVMASKEALKCVVFFGSVRENNFGSRAGKFITRKLTEKGFKVSYLGEKAAIIFAKLATDDCTIAYHSDPLAEILESKLCKSSIQWNL